VHGTLRSAARRKAVRDTFDYMPTVERENTRKSACLSPLRCLFETAGDEPVSVLTMLDIRHLTCKRRRNFPQPSIAIGIR
jgi:hypothetical protein